MEIKFKQGDRVAIPEGCKAVINKNLVVFEKIVPFKTGDVLISKDKETTLIFDKMLDADYFIDIYYLSVLPYRSFVLENFRLATEDEKQLFFDKMKEQGLRWDAQEKRVVKIKWEPTNGESYFFVNPNCKITSVPFNGDDFDRELQKLFNFFRTREQAEKAAEVVKEALRKFHEENE